LNKNRIIFKNSLYFFILFFLLALWAFWQNYYGRLSDIMPFHVHLHGIVMTLWCVLLISQATLIRLKQYKWHRISGKFSFVLVPLIIISGFHIAHISVKGMSPESDIYYFFFALMFNSIIAFSILYFLAIKNRKKSGTHARYMISTVFPILTPVSDRIIHIYLPVMRDFVPTVNGMPMVQLYGFLLVNIILLALIIWDWKLHKNAGAFLIAWFVTFFYQLSVLTFYQFDFLKSISRWLMNLPFS
jgi:hypothetical protein